MTLFRRLVSALAVVACAAGVPVAPTGAEAVASTMTRIAGATRIETAIAASADEFPATGSAKAVVLVRADTFPDALAGGPLAAKVGGPLLLTSPSALDTAVAGEIKRVAPKGSTVYILGGTAAIKTDVDTAVAALGYAVKRVAGTDRYATAVAIADQLGDPTTVFEATGLNFPDALAGVPAAIKTGGAILLTKGNAQSDATAAYLRAHPGGMHYALGGPAALADPAAKAFIGGDRYETAAEIADQFFPTAATIGAATGLRFPDALAAGPDLAMKDAPLLLVPSTGAVPPAATAEILFDFMTARSAVVFGGTASVSDGLADQLGALAGAGSAADTASRSATWTARYGVRAEKVGSNDLTVVIDGNTGDVTTYGPGATTVTVTADLPTRSQLSGVPLDPIGLEASVNSLFASYDSRHGIDEPDPDRRLVWNAEQVLLDPVASPTLRLATFCALAGLDAKIESEVGDSMGRVGIAVTAARGSGTVAYLFDIDTFVPLEHWLYGSDGSVVSSLTVTSMSTSSTIPANPYAS